MDYSKKRDLTIIKKGELGFSKKYLGVSKKRILLFQKKWN